LLCGAQNVDPADCARALEGLDPATTLVIVVSKTFTTAETMLNARTVRQWLVDGLVGSGAGSGSGAVTAESVVRQHMIAVRYVAMFTV
jgi:glucose-6-phosphate isomerase